MLSLASVDADVLDVDRAVAGHRRMPPQDSNDPAGRGGPARVLICDDSADVRSAIAAALQALPGLVVVGQAGDAPGALREAARTAPDVVIVDVNMPGSGVAVTRELSAWSPAPQVVVFSAATAPGSRDELIAAGAQEYVAKTGRLRPLLAAVQHAAGSRARRPGNQVA